MGCPNNNPSPEQAPENTGPLIIQTDLRTCPNVIIECFPHGYPGALVAGTPQCASIHESTQQVLGESLWAPFQSQCDWEIAHWAKMHGPTSSAVTELLAIPGVHGQLVDTLGLSYRMSEELNNIIDKKLPRPPQFHCQELNISSESLQFHHCDVVQCIWTLFGNPEFAHGLVFAPKCHYTNSTQTCCIYDEMHTGDWWWSAQMHSWIHLQIQVLTSGPRQPLKHIIMVQ
ncbi:hypothetical protein H4582DRAFT_1825237 [Lactarius indigo]|nr:hypothetical protein H4582DRAFT_1825237 [Lactarius indigo]